MKQTIWNRAGKPPAQIEIVSNKGAVAADTHCSNEVAQAAGTTYW
jgi:hypothetical protein